MRVAGLCIARPVSRSALPSLLWTALQAITATLSVSADWISISMSPDIVVLAPGGLGYHEDLDPASGRRLKKERHTLCLTRTSVDPVCHCAVRGRPSVCKSDSAVAFWLSNQWIVRVLEGREKKTLQRGGTAVRTGASGVTSPWSSPRGWLHCLGHPKPAPVPGGFDSDPMFYFVLECKS